MVFSTKVFSKIRWLFFKVKIKAVFNISMAFFKVEVRPLNDHRDTLLQDYDFRIGALFEDMGGFFRALFHF